MILLLSGPIGAGKSSVALELESNFKFIKISSSPHLRTLVPASPPPTRRDLQNIGDELDRTTDYRWVVDTVAKPLISKTANRYWLVDSVRKERQVVHFRSAFPGEIFHLHLSAPESALRARHAKRMVTGEPQASYEEQVNHPNEISARSLGIVADLVIDTTTRTATEIASEVAKHISEKSR